MPDTAVVWFRLDRHRSSTTARRRAIERYRGAG